MCTQMSTFQIMCLSLVQLTHQDSAHLPCECVVTACWTNFACLQHFIVLNDSRGTFFWKRSWREVACQYSRVPSECVAMKALRRVSLFGFEASPVTGELSDPSSTYWTFSLYRLEYFDWCLQLWWSQWNIQQPHRLHQSKIQDSRWSHCPLPISPHWRD